MKRVGILATLILLPGIVLGYTSPGKPQGFVNDFAKILTAETANGLNQTLTNFKAETTIEVAIVTVPTLDQESIEVYAVKLFEEWGIGDKEKDNGVLLLVAPTEREVKIEVGYGLEGVFTDAQADGIIRKVITPEFKKGDYNKGIVDGANAIVQVVKAEADYSAVEPEKPGIIASLWNYGFVFIVVLASILGRTKSWWLGGVIGAIAGVVVGFIYGFLFSGIIAIVGLTIFGLFVDFILSKTNGGRGGRGGPWIGGGGLGGGGGFGGFGGGGSGGGGASGRW